MYTNMLSQMKQAKIDHIFDRVLKAVPRVRVDAGCVPLVTPTSQIVGAQAVACVMAESQGKPFYATCSANFVALVKGSYGKTPIPVDPEFRLQVAGVREEVPYDTSAYQPQPNPILTEAGGTRLALDEKETLLLELFPSVADKFLRGVRQREYEAAPRNLPPEPEVDEATRAADALWDELALRAC